MEPKSHEHVWTPWGSEVDQHWVPRGTHVHAKCHAMNGKRPCNAVIVFTFESWLIYRSRLPQFQEEAPRASRPVQRH